LKTKNNRFKGYIETFLDQNNNSEDAISFNIDLKKLQMALMSASIVTQERAGVSKQISFADIAITNPKNSSSGDYRKSSYKVIRSGSKITTVIHKKDDKTQELFKFEQEVFDESALDVHPDFAKLGTEQQGQCKAFYMQVCPYVTESVLTKDKENNIIFINERAKVSRGIIEVLYLLRCSLLHGEVTPDNASLEVYRYSYNLLSAVLKKLI